MYLDHGRRNGRHRRPRLFELVKSCARTDGAAYRPFQSCSTSGRFFGPTASCPVTIFAQSDEPCDRPGATEAPGNDAARRKNWALFQKLFSGDNRFIIQRENGKSSAFALTLILNPEAELSRRRIMEQLKQADIGYRIITGGCFTRHDVIKHYEYECVNDLPNANLAHDQGFFVGNHPFDLTPQLERLREVLDNAAR